MKKGAYTLTRQKNQNEIKPNEQKIVKTIKIKLLID